MADKTSKIKEINHKHKLLSKIFKRALALFIIVIINFNSFSAVVSSNDGSAFITKAEFDALVNDFNSRIEDYEKSIDAKIDGAIAEYLAGLATTATDILVNYFDNYSVNTKYFVDLSSSNKHTNNGSDMGRNCYFQNRIIGINNGLGNNSATRYHGLIRLNLRSATYGAFIWYGADNVGTFRTSGLTFSGIKYPYFDTSNHAMQYRHKQYASFDYINAGTGNGITTTPVDVFNDSKWDDYRLISDINQPGGATNTISGWPWDITGTITRYDVWSPISNSDSHNIIRLGRPSSGVVSNGNEIYWVDVEYINDFSEKVTHNHSYLTSKGANPGIQYEYAPNGDPTLSTNSSKLVEIKELTLYAVKYNKISQHNGVILYEPSITVNQPIFQYNGIPVTRVSRMGTLEFTIRTPNSYTTDTRVILSNTPFDNQSLSATTNKKLLDVNTVISQDKPYKVKVDLSKIEGISYPFTLYVKAYNSNGFQVEIPDDITITSEA